MNLQSEILKSYLSEALYNYLQEFPEDAERKTESMAIQMLDEIKQILENQELDDFEQVEEIANVFRERNIKVSGCHDF